MIDVVILCEYPTLNGGERSALAIVDAMRSAGFNIAFAAPSRGELAHELKRRNILHVGWDLIHANGKRRSLESIRDQLRELLAIWHPDLVHANSLSTARIAGPVASELGLPSIGHLRDIIKLNRATLLDLHANTRLLAVSEATRTWHVEQGLSPAKTFVLYNGMDTDRFRPRASTGYMHRELRLSGNARIALSIGQIGVRKGLDVTLAALSTILVEFPNLHFLIAGERNSTKQEAVDYEQQLRVVANRLPFQGHVHFLGRRTDVPRLLNEATVLIHAARQEPLGRVLLEAAASGVPIICSQVGGTEEIFPAATQSARLVPADDSTVLTHAIRDILRSDTLRASLSARGRSRISEQFSLQKSASGLIEHYRQVLALFSENSPATLL